MKLTYYRGTILRLAEANGATEDVGRDMFAANLEAAARGEEPRYKGAEGFDYGALCHGWTALTDEERAAQNAAYIEAIRG